MNKLTLTGGPGYIRLVILGAIAAPVMYGVMILALKWMYFAGQIMDGVR